GEIVAQRLRMLLVERVTGDDRNRLRNVEQHLRPLLRSHDDRVLITLRLDSRRLRVLRRRIAVLRQRRRRHRDRARADKKRPNRAMNLHPSSPPQNDGIIAAVFQEWQLVSNLMMSWRGN